MKYYSYENFRDDTNVLIEKTKGFEADVILAIARGGFCIGHCMAEGLNIRDLQSLRTELYDADQKRECISIFGECKLDENVKVLVVDDISDSGETLKSIMEHLRSEHPSVEFKTAALFYKKTSVYEPDFWVNEATEWIDFFWEADYRAE